MRLRPTGAPVLIATLLAALAYPAARAADPGRPLLSVTDYLGAFAHAYQPGDYDAVMLLDAEAGVRRASLALLPEVSFEQGLEWDAYSTLSLAVDTRLRLPLYDSRARPSLALAGADHDAARAAVGAARADAELAFFVDLATYAALAEAAAGLAPALQRFVAAPWLTDPGFDSRNLAPADRGLYEAHLRLLDMDAFLVAQVAEVESRLARLLGVDTERLTAPSRAAVTAALPRPPDAEACLATAPAVSAARLRHQRATLVTALDTTAPVTVALTGDVALAVGGTTTAPGTPASLTTSATFAVEARVALPPGRGFWQDVDGSISATASPTGASQSLRVTWPRPPHSTFFSTDPDAALAEELHEVSVTLRALSRAAAQAAFEHARIERSLDWLLLDNFGSALTSPAATGTGGAGAAATYQAALLPDTPPGLVAQLADLSAQLAFAELEEVIAVAQLASACGSWP